MRVKWARDRIPSSSPPARGTVSDLAALRYYLRVVSAEIESHHHVEDEDGWPFL